MKILTPILISFSILMVTNASAGNLYRFIDDNGVSTMSKTLPPHIAQRGYDILDESSFRVLEKIAPAPSEEEIAEIERKQAEQKEQKRLAKIEAKKQKERQRQAMLYDANLKAHYRSEDELLKKQETELLYFQNQIEKTEGALKRNKSKLYEFQKQAADIELSGRAVSVNLKKRLAAAEQEIQINEQELTRLASENISTSEQYSKDLIRLRELLAIDAKKASEATKN